jgi:hypothetical protein
MSGSVRISSRLYLGSAGLVISQEGDLVDTKTGKVINEFGATRFDVAVRALRGELDPAPWVDVSTWAAGLLGGTLLKPGFVSSSMV